MQAAVGFSCGFSGALKGNCVRTKQLLSNFCLRSDSEMRVQRVEQRALKAEEALQLALVKIQELERKLQGKSSPSAEGAESQTSV